MNRIEFYSRLDHFKSTHLSNEELEHSASNYGKQYYNKIDKYYPDGSARYFYTKAEWDAYQEGQARTKYEAEKKKKIENNSNLKLYNVTKEQRENYNKNRDAANNAEEDRWTKVKTDNIKKEATEAATKSLPSFKLSAEDLLKLKAQNSEDNKYMTKEQSEQNNNNLKDIKQKEQYEKNKAADEAKKKAEQDKYAEIRRQNEREALRQKAKRKIEEEETKRKGKENLEKALKQREEERAAAKKAQQIEDAKKRIAEREAQAKSAQNMSDMGKKIEAEKRARDEEIKARVEAKKKFAEDSKAEINAEYERLKKNIEDVFEGKSDKIDKSNKLYRYFEDFWKQQDDDFAEYKKSMVDYIEPTTVGGIEVMNYPARKNNALKALEAVKNGLDKLADKGSYEDTQHKTLLSKYKNMEDTKKNLAINGEMANARLAVSKMYTGDSKTLNLNKSLKKQLDNKIKDLDSSYDGDLYNYVSPDLFGKFMKDDDAYSIVKQALDELESDLRSAKETDEIYGDFIKEVTKLF